MRIVLVHSPLLGKSSWGEVPDRLAELGHTVAVPDLRPVLDSGPPFYRRLFQAIAARSTASEAGSEAVAVVGHSRAGPLLPGALAAMKPTRAMAIFLDARLPHDGRTWLETLTADRRADLLASIDNGRLPPWDRWFPAASLAELIPDATARQRFRDDLRGLPAALLTEPMPHPTFDDHISKAYMQLSAAYAGTADEAEAIGWAVTRYPMNHLAPLTRSQAVADAINRQCGSIAALW